MSDSDREDELREEVSNFLRRNFPQIQMHGGSAAIQSIDLDEGEVSIQLGGACSGCGISPMTIQAIKTRMTDEIDEISTVNAHTGASSADGTDGMGGGSVSPTTKRPDDDDTGPAAPF